MKRTSLLILCDDNCLSNIHSSECCLHRDLPRKLLSGFRTRSDKSIGNFWMIYQSFFPKLEASQIFGH